jgi:hypothetical protein
MQASGRTEACMRAVREGLLELAVKLQIYQKASMDFD